jgi:dihydrofolate synthase/folylpolyglutamate synthase
MDEFVESAGGEEWAPPRYEIPLLGHHQVVNTAVAYATLQTLKARGLTLSDQAIREGLATVHWLGRFQILSKDPIIVIDSAHNRESALKLRIALDDYFPGHPVTLIFGASADKDIAGMLTELTPRISRLIATQADHPRAEDPQSLASIGHSHGLKVEVIVPVADALTFALERLRPSEVLLAAGSVFIAGEVLTAWESAEDTG